MSEPNRANIRAWVDALRSGEYVQAQFQLREGDGMCCLGVACDISGVGEWKADGNGRHVYRVASDYDDLGLPLGVQEWLGVSGSEPQVAKLPVSSWNDREGKSFAEIADLIEAEFLS